MKKIFDFIGIGFGPSNIALAIANHESNNPLDSIFLEKSESFSWHSGMLFDDATMQVSFLKDLASFRNPRSYFTFVNYLHENNRLADFTNLQTFFPTRIEFTQYLEWCATAFSDCTKYNHEVVAIKLIFDEITEKNIYSITVKHGLSKVEYLAKSVIHSAGLTPKMPHKTEKSSNVFHGYNFLNILKDKEISNNTAQHFAVVGGGQSAAEIVDFLLTNYSKSTVTAVVPQFGYIPADNSPFVNQIFDPDHVDTFFKGSKLGRENILNIHKSANYNAPDLDIIQRLYFLYYQDKLKGTHRFHFMRCTHLQATTIRNDIVELSLRNILNDKKSVVESDFLICATGFSTKNAASLMDEKLRSLLKYNDESQLVHDRNYRLIFEKRLPPFYSLGTSENTHGISTVLLSNMAIRSGEILADLKQFLSN